jgi:putative transcriptional regulator
MNEKLDPPEWTEADFKSALRHSQRRRIMAGKLQAGDVAAVRRFVQLSQPEFAAALGISVHTLRNWEQDRRAPTGPGLALIRIAARNPVMIRANVPKAAA